MARFKCSAVRSCWMARSMARFKCSAVRVAKDGSNHQHATDGGDCGCGKIAFRVEDANDLVEDVLPTQLRLKLDGCTGLHRGKSADTSLDPFITAHILELQNGLETGTILYKCTTKKKSNTCNPSK